MGLAPKKMALHSPLQHRLLGCLMGPSAMVPRATRWQVWPMNPGQYFIFHPMQGLNPTGLVPLPSLSPAVGTATSSPAQPPPRHWAGAPRARPLSALTSHSLGQPLCLSRLLLPLPHHPVSLSLALPASLPLLPLPQPFPQPITFFCSLLITSGQLHRVPAGPGPSAAAVLCSH